MLNSFDNDMSLVFDGAAEQEIRDDLEILEEYLGGMLLPALAADAEPMVAEPWQDNVVESVVSDGEEFQTAVADEEPAGTSFTTSTMAEIYVSQGFIQRAIDIYEEMLTENPLNDGIIKRIEELRALLAPSAFSMATSEESIAAAPSDEMVPLQAGLDEEKGVVETLERWLDNISSRRQ